MEVSTCLHPGCGLRIGGRNHEPEAGNVRMNDEELQGNDAPLGYSLDATIGGDCDDILRLSRLSCRVMRLVIHLLMRTACQSSPTAHGEMVAGIMFEGRGTATASRALQELGKRIDDDWTALLRITGYGECDLALLLHSSIALISELRPVPAFKTQEVRSSYETAFESKCIAPIFDGHRREFLQTIRASLQEANRGAQFIVCLGENRFSKLFEQDCPARSKGTACPHESRLWQIREPITFSRFEQAFASRAGNDKLFPLLSLFFKEERRISAIKCIADILSWHAVLFEALPMYSISRAESSSLANKDVIARLPLSRQAHARAVLDAFCASFNEGFPHVANLYECQANPFLNKDGGVDLSGSMTGSESMTPSTPVAFSLPSMLHGETDAQGLCTIQLINVMQACHNELLSSLGKVRGLDDSAKPLPSVSYQTPHQYVSRLLIRYDRERRFLPLLRLWASQSLEYGNGGSTEYNMAGIQSALANSIIGIARPISVHIHLYSFAGEMQRSGLVAKLNARLPQVPLQPALINAICAEVDTQHQLVQLTQLLETCIEFLVSTGASHTPSFGATPLGLYVTNTLLIDPAHWSDVASPAIEQHVLLIHIQSLFLALEERVAGSGLDRVALLYRAPLPAELCDALKIASHHLQLLVLLSVLRDLLVQQLTREDWPADAVLKQYLAYATEIDLEAEDWFQRYASCLCYRMEAEGVIILHALATRFSIFVHDLSLTCAGIFPASCVSCTPSPRSSIFQPLLGTSAI
jgi:hypothetical protein